MQNQIDLSEYEIIKRLGNQTRRRFCDVYLVQSKNSQEQFILKAAKDALGIERLEAEAGFNFEHQSLPQVIAFKKDDAGAILLLQYKNGKTLDSYFKDIPKKILFEQIIQLCNQIAIPLEELKRQGVAHLDLKPSNILVNERGEVILIDFGLSIHYAQLTSRKLIFPLGYAAPEVLLNKLHIVDHRSDLFSIAVILYQLIVGKLPLIHANPSITTNLQLTHPLPEIDNIDKFANTALLKLGYKHSFTLPPNRMDQSEVDVLLMQAKNIRYGSLTDFISDFEKGKIKRFWPF